MSSDDTKQSLFDTDIVTAPLAGRRGFLGLAAAGGAATAATALLPQRASAQGTDIDNGAWTDSGNCGRGGGGIATGLTDADSGAITDAAGWGRGAPYC